MAKLKIVSGIKEETAGEQVFGSIFRTGNYKGNDAYMRVDAKGFMTNSSVYKERVLTGEYVLVVQLGSAMTHLLKADTVVTRVKSAELKLV